MTCESSITETQLKLYATLIDQLQKHTTIVWQYSMAIFLADAYALEKFQNQPYILWSISVISGVMAYAFHRVVIQQYAIIKATQKVEDLFVKNKYEDFIPQFRKNRISAPQIIVVALYGLSALLFIFASLQYIYLLNVE